MSGKESSDLSEPTRRAILKGVGSTLGVAATGGVAGGHPESGDHGNEDHDHVATDDFRMTNVGYHSLGGLGSESVSGSPDDPHYGGVSELRVKGDIAAVGLLSSKSPTLDRGIAVLDVSAYTRARSREELERAEMSVLSFVPNENGGASVMDVKFSGDGSYLFAAQQPVAGVFAATAEQVPEGRTEGESAANAEQAGLLAIDVSTPGDPEVVGRVEYDFGMHNCYHHRINGEDYVFGVAGPLGEPAGVYVHRLDRSTGGMERVNFWTFNTEARQGEFGNPAAYANATDNEYYAHDVTVIDDPVTGDPYAYLANWGTGHDSGDSESGARVLDVSDPTDIEELGVFTMERAHTIEPLRRTLDGKRLFVVGQENPDPDSDTGDGSEEYGNETGHTGFYYLVDATGVENSGELGTASLDDQESTAGDELAKWVWRENAAFDAFTYSAHNIDTFRTEIGGDTRAFVTTGHYHAGTRILEIGHPSGPAVAEEDRDPEAAPYDEEPSDDAARPVSEGGNPSGSNGWTLAEAAWSRTHFETPEDAKFTSLSSATPYRWCAVEENGVVFSSDISTGIYAMRLEDPANPVGTRTVVDPKIDLIDDGTVFTGGQTNRLDLDVSTEAAAEVRLNLPKLWDPVAGDDYTVREVGDNTIVEFDDPVDGDELRTVFVEVPEAGTGTAYTVGPAEVTPDVGKGADQQVWTAVPETEDTDFVAGVSAGF